MTGLGPLLLVASLFILLLLGIVFLDKWIRRKHSISSANTDLELARKVLESLPESAGLSEIQQNLNKAWCQQIPSNVLQEAIETFGDRIIAFSLLVAANTQLNGDIPAEICRSPEGEEKVLTELHQIKWNVYV